MYNLEWHWRGTGWSVNNRQAAQRFKIALQRKPLAATSYIIPERMTNLTQQKIAQLYEEYAKISFREISKVFIYFLTIIGEHTRYLKFS